nr:hypothetical protein Iba_chr09bCG11440 [Ipomoea batatas]
MMAITDHQEDDADYCWDPNTLRFGKRKLWELFRRHFSRQPGNNHSDRQRPDLRRHHRRNAQTSAAATVTSSPAPPRPPVQHSNPAEATFTTTVPSLSLSPPQPKPPVHHRRSHQYPPLSPSLN